MTKIVPNQQEDVVEKTGYIDDKDTSIKNGSMITIKSNQVSIEENEFDDAESSYDSLDSVTTDSKPSEVQIQTVNSRSRALTVTQNNLNESDNNVLVPGSLDLSNIHDQIHELEDQAHNSDVSDSDSFHSDGEAKQRRRHESHRSTISSIHSFASSASNYDLLLARLGSKDSPVSSAHSEQLNELTTITGENDDDIEQDEIDWGRDMYKE